MSKAALAILVLAVSGCAASQPDDLRGFVAVSGKYALMQMVEKTKVCSNCNGTGVVGDGKKTWPCDVCSPSKEPKPCLTGTCATKR